jgi:DNA primase
VADREAVERVRQANRLEAVAARYTDLQPAGRDRLKGRCPLHHDDTPSFFVYVAQQRWWCYGCQAGADLPGPHDVFKLVMLAENVTFTEAVARLSAGVAADAPVNPPPPRPPEPERVLSPAEVNLITLAAEIYHANLLAFPPALDYLARRGLDMAAVRRHRLGYAGGERLRKYLRLRGWDEDLACGLRLIRERGGREHLHDRIVIPEWRGERAIYLAGRTLGSGEPKYLFLDGAPKPLYGLEAIQDQAEVFVTEGLFDWLALIAWGYPAACLLGTWLKQTHRSHFDTARRIVLAFDSDRAGREAARRLTALWPDRAVMLALPEGVKDIGDLAQRPDGRRAFQSRLL